ncbi:MAG: Hsp20/alpha crystallin family protein [Gammaproteobacteria bacterium]
MSTLQDLKHGLSRAWDGIAEGWRDFTARAGDALTRFNPVHRASGGDEARARHVAAGSRWGVLAAEVKVDDDSVEVTLECPGMDEDDFTIDVLDDVLVVRGEKHIEQERTQGRFHVMERAYGSFERALRLPVAVDESGGRASYRRGVLHVHLPRAVHTRVRKIPVQGA